MLSKLWMQGIAAVVLAAAISGSLYSGYAYIKNIGYKEAEIVVTEKYEKRIAEYNNTVVKKVEFLEELSKTLVEDNKTTNELLISDINSFVRKNVKGKTTTIIKDGVCSPSQNYSDTINSVNKRINEELKK